MQGAAAIVRGRAGRTARRAAAPLAAALALACGAPAPPGSTPSSPNLLWIVSDALRADAIECRSAGSTRTPHLCALAARGALLENAYSNAPWTLPSAVSLFTGMHSTLYDRVPDADAPHRRIYFVPDDEELLGEALRRRGYDVVAFVDNALAAQSNALQGFEQRSSEPVDARTELGEALRRTGLDLRDPRYRKLVPALRYLLESRPEPFALLLWIYDPHAVYVPPPWRLAHLAARAAALPRPLEYYLGLGHRDEPERGLRKLKREARSLQPGEVEFLRELYGEEVASMDERVGSVLAALELSGATTDTLVVFTSDHGEGFGEHRHFLHGSSYFDELVRVPLLLAGPGIEPGRRVERSVSHVDLVPTLGALLGVRWRDDLQGRSFASLLGDGPPPAGDDGAADEVYLAGAQGPAFDDALVRGPLKLIARRNGRRGLFDRRADPGERSDLAAAEPALVARMASRLAGIRRENERLRGEREHVLGDEETLRRVGEETAARLRELGYVE